MTFYFHVHRQGRTITKSFGRTRDRAPKQAAGVAYFNEQGELLLCKRRTGITDHPGEWAFPAGGVEPGESPAAAARREFKEELDHSLPSLAQQPAVEHGSFTAYVYWGETFTPDLDHEHTECGWFHTEYLPEPTHPGVVAVLEAMPSVVLAHLLSERAPTKDSDFKEDEHPRDGDGKFTAGAGGGSSGPKPTKATAKGSKAGVHELLSSGHPFTVEELMEATGSTNRVTITTALSDLKNPKYAGALGHLAITKRPDGMYHVEKATTSTAAEAKEAPTTKPAEKTPREDLEALLADPARRAKLPSYELEHIEKTLSLEKEARGPDAHPGDLLYANKELNNLRRKHITAPKEFASTITEPTVVHVQRTPDEGTKHWVKLPGDDREFPIVKSDSTQGLGPVWGAAIGGHWDKYAEGPTPSQNGYINMGYLGDTKEEALRKLPEVIKRLDASPHYSKLTSTDEKGITKEWFYDRRKGDYVVTFTDPNGYSELGEVYRTRSYAEAEKMSAATQGLKTKAEQDEEAEKRYGGGTMARAKTKEPTTPATPYTGPAYHMIESLDDYKHAVVRYPEKKRLGTYPSFEMADRVRKGHDERAIKEHVKAQKDQPKAPEWKKDEWQSFHRATLASGHTASKAEHPNGDVTYTVRGGGSTFVHNIKTDSEGTILHHRVEMPTTIQTVKGPAPGTTQKGLNPNQAAKHAGVYKDLGLVPWHKQEERQAAEWAEEDAKIKKQVEASRGYQENRGYSKMERAVRDLPDSTPSERSFRDQIDNIVDSARINANDTVDVEKAAKPEEWHDIFEGTLVSILSDTRDPPPRLLEWFASHGVKP